MPVHTEDGRVDGIAAVTIRLAEFISARQAEDLAVADGLRFACKLPDKMPDFSSCGGPTAEAYWQHFTPIQIADQVQVGRQIMGWLARAPHNRCSGYVKGVWVGKPCDCETYRMVEEILRVLAQQWRTHPDYAAATAQS
jgi:hypothetical protein